MTIHLALSLFCDLKADTPEQVLETLRYMLRNEDYEFNNPPDHPFFHGPSGYETWRNLFQDPEWGAGFDDFMGTSVRIFHSGQLGKKISLRCEVGSHGDFEERQLPFLQWLAPYVDVECKSDLVGFLEIYNTRSDEPALIYFTNSKVFFKKVNRLPEPVEVTHENFFDLLWESS